MKVLTLNTHSWMEEDPYGKLESLVESLAAEAYDIIALQEVNQSMDGDVIKDETFISPREDQLIVPIKEDNFAYLLVEKLKEKGLSYYWSWAANHIGYDVYDEGVAVLSREPFKAESHLISRADDYASHYTRKVLKAKIERSGKRWTVMSAHYSWWKNDQEEKLFQHEWEQTLAVIQPDERERLIVMGDFNNEPQTENEGYALIERTAPFIKDSFKAAGTSIGEATVERAIDGWEGHQDHKRIDYVFVGNGVQVNRYRVVFDGKAQPVISDHFGVEAMIDEKLTKS